MFFEIKFLYVITNGTFGNAQDSSRFEAIPVGLLQCFEQHLALGRMAITSHFAHSAYIAIGKKI